MAQACTEESAIATLASGLRKVKRFEGKTGLSVARVIAAPHGAFTDRFATATNSLSLTELAYPWGLSCGEPAAALACRRRMEFCSGHG